MNTQPEALRLADALDNAEPDELLETPVTLDAAAELRRLHAVNTELVEALYLIADEIYDPWTNGAKAGCIARAAIAKATGEQA